MGEFFTPGKLLFKYDVGNSKCENFYKKDLVFFNRKEHSN